jgi:putative flippase GtrA
MSEATPGRTATTAAHVQIARFVVVGVSAALTHWLVAVLAMQVLNPLLANAAGFGVAFPVSFIGHWRWSFGDHGAHWVSALPRFALVACSSFAGNELLFATLLQWFGWPAPATLALTLLLVASATFVLSRSWAFARRR